jgi:hypothetical protein
MTDEGEFAARWQFKWQRDGSDWTTTAAEWDE